MRDLTVRAKTFALEYLVDLCAKDAAIRAGYSPHTAKEKGYQLLQDDRVKIIVHKQLEKRRVKLDLSTDRVLEEMAAVAFSEISEIVDWKGKDIDVKRKEDIPRHALASIAEIRRRKGPEGQVDLHIKMHSKIKALELLGRYMDLWQGTKNVEVNIITGNQLQEQLLKRLERVIDAEVISSKEDQKQIET